MRYVIDEFSQYIKNSCFNKLSPMYAKQKPVVWSTRLAVFFHSFMLVVKKRKHRLKQT